MQLRVVWMESQCLLERSDGITVFFLGHLEVGAKSQSVSGGRVGVGRFVDLSQSGFELFLVDQETDELGAYAVVAGIDRKILLVGLGCFRLPLRVEALRQA